jgi:hypothetical protein
MLRTPFVFSTINCPVCGKPITFRENTCADERGKALHENCYAKVTMDKKCSRAILTSFRLAELSVGTSLGRTLAATGRRTNKGHRERDRRS